MFLEWISQLQFFTPSPTSGVYLGFPKQIRRAIASQVVTHLLQDESASALLSSKQHVIVAMETVGQTFGLDVDDHGVIMQCADLYRRWLITQSRPVPLSQDCQFFYVEMFKHFSLLFTPREAGAVEMHAKMCISVLETLETAARDIGHTFSQDTWESLLKIMMGINDHLLRPHEVMTPLANILCPYLIKALFTLWLRSRTRNNWMWDKLKELIQAWRHRMPIVSHWIAVCFSFTSAVVHSLYSTMEPSVRLTVQSFGVVDEFEFDQDTCRYFWYRLLHVYGDLETLDSPFVYLEAQKGIALFARMFFVDLDVQDPMATRPDGNEILHVFGPFLFDAINLMRPGFEPGKAEAFHLLLQIAHDKHETDFDEAYLSALYRGLLQGIASGSGLLIDTILTNGAALLQSNLRGVKLLIPAFWSAVSNVLSQNFNNLEGARSPPAHLRNCCYRIINYLIAMPHLFDKLTFGAYFDDVFMFRIPPNTTFLEMANLRALLLDSLANENDDANRVTLMSMMLTLVFESPATIGDFPMQFVRAIASLMVSAWTAPVVSMGIQTFQHLSEVFHLLDRTNDALPALLVNSLCDYLDILMHDRENRSGMNDELMIRCFSCNAAWIMLPPPNQQWLIKEQLNQPKDKTLLFKVMSSIFMGITGRHNATAGVAIADGASPQIFVPTEQVIFAAKFLLHNLTNMNDLFPSLLGPSVVSAQRVEAEEALLTGLRGSKNVQVVIAGNSIISIIRHPRRQDGSFAVTVITRDSGGKQVWHASNFFGSGIDPYHTAPFRAVDDRNVLAIAPADPVDPQFLEELFLFLNADERDRHYRLLDKVNQRHETERITLTSRHYGWTDDVTVHPPGLPQTDEILDSTVARVFLSNMGFNTMQSRTRVFSVRDSADSPFDYHTAFSELDATPERDQLTVGIIYIADGSQSEQQIMMSSAPGSGEYQYFLQRIGWEVDLATHRGYSGHLNPAVTGPTSMYFSNWDVEVMFYASTMLRTQPAEAFTTKHALLSGNSVLVLWIDHVGDFLERGAFNVLKNSQASVLIIISPATPVLCRINIVNRNQHVRIGPLVDDAIVSRHALPTLVRLTAINDAMHLSQTYMHRQMLQRQVMIDEFIRTHRNDCPSYMYYSKIFA